MLQTTAQRFGSLGKSFVSPSAVAAVIGAALLASDTTDTAETAWSPAAACLLPDVLPVAGTLLSYGGNRQLAAGGTVTHSGALNLGANALTVGAITASGSVMVGNAVSGQIFGIQAGNGVSAGSDFSYLRFSTNWGNIDFKSWGGRLGLYGTGLSQVASPAFVIDSTGSFSASSGTAFTASSDVFQSRASAGVWRFGTTSTGTDAGIVCGAITASGAIQETPTQSALDPTTANIPTGKRQGWYNSTLSEFRDWVNIGGTLLKSAAYT